MRRRIIINVIVYTKPHCVQCTATVRWLTNAGIDFEARDLTEPDNLEYVKGLGHQAAPVVVLERSNGEIIDHWSGFNPPRLSDNLT